MLSIYSSKNNFSISTIFKKINKVVKKIKNKN